MSYKLNHKENSIQVSLIMDEKSIKKSIEWLKGNDVRFSRYFDMT